jgi:hypothetical protein
MKISKDIKMAVNPFLILTLLAVVVIKKAAPVHFFVPLHKRGGISGLQLLRGLVTASFLV